MKHPRIDVLDTGRRIQNWMIQLQPKITVFNQVTERLFDVISKVTEIEQNNIPAIIIVGVGRAVMKYYNAVFLY